MELRIVPNELPIIPIRFTDDGFYHSGCVHWAEDLFNVIYCPQPENTPETVIDDIRLKHDIEPAIEIIYTDADEIVSCEILPDDLHFLWNEIRLNDKYTGSSQLEQIRKHMGFYSNWETMFLHALDDTFDLQQDNGIDVENSVILSYQQKAFEQMSTDLLDRFSDMVMHHHNTGEPVMPFYFEGLAIDIRNTVAIHEQKIPDYFPDDDTDDDNTEDTKEDKPNYSEVEWDEPVKRVFTILKP